EFPDKLKKSILQYAMQGKLVEQDPNDESVEVLLEKIRAEKQKLFEEGKIKKKDLEISIVSKGDDNSYYEEVPYDIPESWMFVKLNVVANIFSGYSFKSSEYSNEGIRIVRISDFDENGLINKNIVRQKYQEKFNKFEIYQNDILLAMTGGTVGKNTILQTLPERMFLNQRVTNIRSYYIKYNFIYHF
ncbi:type I restriction endonuclease subunit S, partial [Streptococcus pneumoniae]